MTLILKFELHMVKMYRHNRKLSFYVKHFKSVSLNRQTDTHYENITYLTKNKLVMLSSPFIVLSSIDNGIQ